MSLPSLNQEAEARAIKAAAQLLAPCSPAGLRVFGVTVSELCPALLHPLQLPLNSAAPSGHHGALGASLDTGLSPNGALQELGIPAGGWGRDPEQYRSSTHTVPSSSSVPHGVLALIPAGFSLSACTGWGLFSKPTRSPRGSSWSCACSVPGVLLVGDPADTRRGNWASCLHTSASLVPVPCNSSGA